MHAAILFLATVAPVETAREEDAKKELAGLQGVWRCMTYMASDERVLEIGRTAGVQGSDKLVIVGKRFHFSVFAGNVILDVSKKPYGMDLTTTVGVHRGKTVLCIFERTGDTLRLGFPHFANGAGRPSTLKPDKESKHVLYTFQRDTKPSKEQAAALLEELTGALPPPPDSKVAIELLQKLLDRMEKMDKRLEAIEKQLAPAKK